MPLRTTALPALVAFALAVGGCAPRQLSPKPDLGAIATETEHVRLVDERKDEVIRQIAICESGGYGPSEKPIYGGRGLYLGRLQFATRTVIAYVQKRDGIALNPKEAAALAHDYDRAADLAKYMLFDLVEPWHWPVCARKLGVVQQIAAINQL